MTEGLASLFGIKRSAEDFFAERVRFVLGGQLYILPVRSRGDNRAWKEDLEATEFQTLRTLDALDDPKDVLALLSESDDALLGALLKYDHTGVLPPRDEIDAQATDIELYRAVAEVWLAANPKAAIAIGLDYELPTSPMSMPTAPGSSGGLLEPSIAS